MLHSIPRCMTLLPNPKNVHTTVPQECTDCGIMLGQVCLALIIELLLIMKIRWKWYFLF